MNYRLFFISVLCMLSFSFCSQPVSDLQAVKSVDLNRYVGKWYEIASYPQKFQKGCTCTTAEYTNTNKGYIIVENRCNKDSINGKEAYIKGKAFVEPNSGNAKLKVQFFWPIKSKYWIIDLGNDYDYAVVSEPSKKYLWILCRTPYMEKSTYEKIIEKLKMKGFDVSTLQKTIHP